MAVSNPGIGLTWRAVLGFEVEGAFWAEAGSESAAIVSGSARRNPLRKRVEADIGKHSSHCSGFKFRKESFSIKSAEELEVNR
jgi:hypothetical protein